ncbi:MAG: GGDEF domain-containing protein, partial [Planctomycetes bacterium]|nr:GGDEF domain-containing protein [Planctomycetota bacterium]
WDGTGYPDALHGQRIPLLARIMAVADAYDAMTSNRPYRPPMPKADAIRELQAAAGAQFDPELTSVFTKTLAASADGQSDARTS